MTEEYPQLLRQSADYYRDYLSKTVSLELPDEELQRAYDWSRVSMIQGLVTNPYLGTGLVAGYRTSGESQRPGFAWFFGRDSMWTSLALDASGDFATTRKALEFIGKYQREDGKIPHEIAQGANFVNWFKDYPYAYASADATPLYIIAMNDYIIASGDTALAKLKWDSVWKAYQFLRSTYDAQGLPAEFWLRPRLGRRRPAAPGKDRTLPKWFGRGSVARVEESGATRRQRNRKQGTPRRIRTPTNTGQQCILAPGEKKIRLRPGQGQSSRR